MFVNTRYLSPVVMEGITTAPQGSYEYVEWWEEQYRRCMEGYSAGGTSITGLHYYYLNFWPIRRKVEGSAGKRMANPRFLDMDHLFFWELQKAIEMGKDLMVLKRRQAGFSYKTACFGGHQFEFHPDSHTLITSGVEKYSVNTMRMLIQGLDSHANTEFYKHRSPDKPGHFIQASFTEKSEDGTNVVSGIMSKVERRTATTPQALVGLSPTAVVYEEMTVFKDISKVKLYMDDGLREMGVSTGIQVLIGTGGEDGTSLSEVAEMIYDTGSYNLMSYDDVFDVEDEVITDAPGQRSKVCLFIPGDYFTGCTDEDGNSNREMARLAILERRKELERNKDAWMKYVTQHPLTVQEALMQPSGNVFPVRVLQEQKANILRYSSAKEMVRTISIDWEKDGQGNILGVTWKDDPFGRYRMVEPPVKGDDGNVPQGLYVAGTDSYDRDATASEATQSLGACVMFKTFHSASDETYEMPVCKLVERPPTAEEFYEDTAKLCVMYGWAMNLIEYSNILIFNWYRRNGFGHLLKGRPMVAYAHMSRSNVQNRDGIDPATKSAWETMTSDFLSDGGASRLRDIETIDKLIKYRSDTNCDESIAFMLAVVHMKDLPRVARERVRVEPMHYMRYVVRNGRMMRV